MRIAPTSLGSAGDLDVAADVRTELDGLLAPEEVDAVRGTAGAPPDAGAVPGARAGDPPVPMAADLTFATFPTPIGPFTVVAGADGVVATTSGDPRRLVDQLVGASTWRRGRRRSAPPAATSRRTSAGGAARLRTPVDLRLASTPFARSPCWGGRRDPYGELGPTATSRRAPDGRAPRVRPGTVLARSPIELFVPCHRVVPAGPGFGTYGDDDRRLFLLRLEGSAERRSSTYENMRACHGGWTARAALADVLVLLAGACSRSDSTLHGRQRRDDVCDGAGEHGPLRRCAATGPGRDLPVRPRRAGCSC